MFSFIKRYFHRRKVASYLSRFQEDDFHAVRDCAFEAIELYQKGGMRSDVSYVVYVNRFKYQIGNDAYNEALYRRVDEFIKSLQYRLAVMGFRNRVFASYPNMICVQFLSKPKGFPNGDFNYGNK